MLVIAPLPPRRQRQLSKRALVSLGGLLVALGACQPAPAPSTAPSAPPPTAPAPTTLATVPPPTLAPTPSAPAPTVDTSGSLADQLRDAISVDDILADLGRLNQIALSNGGTRATGGSGFDASAEFVAAELRAAGYEVELAPADLLTFKVDAPTVLEIPAGTASAFADTRDLKPMLLSPGGDVTAKVFALGFNPRAGPGSRNGLGCVPSDWEDVPKGVIALVQPGECRRRDVIANASGAGAVAVVMSWPEWKANALLRPTLTDPAGLVPAVAATHEVGRALNEAAEDGVKVRLMVSTTVEIETTHNVIAETPGGDPTHVLMLGGHLDSVIDGPGINDNGSGTMTVLEIARELARLRPQGAPWKVRVAFWTGEETGLFGSFDYVSKLGAEGLAIIEAYLNFDMLGSRNGVRQVYEGSEGSRPVASGLIQALFTQALDEAGLAWELTTVGGASDHFPFDQVGVPNGGLFSGASDRKSEKQAALFGGTAGEHADPCYHLACDTTANIDPELLEQLARIAAWVSGRLASGEILIPEG